MADKVWAKHDACLAYCSLDGEYHPAVIRRIRKRAGHVTVEVRYDGYDSGENEILHLDQVQEAQAITPGDADSDVLIVEPRTPPSERTIFGASASKEMSPLKSRFAALDDEIVGSSESRRMEHASRLIIQGIQIQHDRMERPRKTTKKEQMDEKESLAASIEDVESPIRDELESPQPGTSTTRPEQEMFGPIEGFSERDLERPLFPFSAPGPKIPLVLQQDPLIQVPGTLNQYLRHYQREGISFLYNNYTEDRGGLLLDDMGLGKTVQVIGFLSAVLHKTGTARDLMKHRPDFIRKLSEEDLDEADEQPRSSDDEPRPQWLIVCPGSVLYNWCEELETWGYFSVGRFHQIQKERTLHDAMRGKLEIVLTTFETLRENLSDLNRIEWAGCIVDEVHKIKERNALVTKALNEIRTKRRFGLTGTALQNNMMELWCLLDWANPGCLGEKGDFEERFGRVIERGQRYESSKRELAEARRMKEEFTDLTKGMMIRRMKTLIADQLPKKYDQVVYCRLSTLQRDVYRAILRHQEMRLVLDRDNLCRCGSRRAQKTCCKKTNKYGDSIKSITFSFMHLLLKASNHPALLVSERTSSARQRRLFHDILSKAFEGHDDYVRGCEERALETLSDPDHCGKMKVLTGMLNVFKKEDAKVLLFSYSTKTLDIIEHDVMTAGYEYSRLDGSVNEKRRQQLVREFNRDPHLFICLISTKAGGVGLNLTGANVVIIYDPNWNPTHDLQAQDRAYRIGQQRDVRVYRLITTGTIEENMYLRQIYKQQLDNVALGSKNARRYFNAVQGDLTQKGELFGLENMFTLRNERNCLTEEILQRNERTETKIAGYDVADYVTTDKVERTNYERETSSDDDDSVGSSLESSDFFSSDSDSSPVKPRRHLVEISGTTSPRPSTSGEARVVSPRKARKENSRRRRTVVNTRRKDGGNFQTVSQVFDECGVVHVHANRDVVGPSRAEDHMTRCAIRDVYHRNQNSQEYALHCETMEGEETIQKTPVKEKGPRSMIVDGRKLLIGQTPKTISSGHFSAMADWCDVTEAELARQIVDMTSSQRLDLLVEFYKFRGIEMSDVFYVERGSSKEGAVTASSPDRPPRKKTPRSQRRRAAIFDSDPDTSQSITDSVQARRELNDRVRVSVSQSPEKSSFMNELLDDLLGTEIHASRKPSVKRKLVENSAESCGNSGNSTPMEILDHLLGLGNVTRRKAATKRKILDSSSASCGNSGSSTPKETSDVQSKTCDGNLVLDQIFNSNSTVRKRAPKRKITQSINDSN